MALGDMYDDDDESYHSAPPRQSMLPDLPDDVDGGTVQSLEFGRRAFSEDPRHLGGRFSERFGDMSELGAVEEEFEIDGTFINQRGDRDLEQEADDALDDDNTTTQMRVLTGRRDGRQSDVDLGVFGDAEDDTEEPTFRFLIPDRLQAPNRDEPEEELDEGDDDNALPGMEEEREDGSEDEREDEEPEDEEESPSERAEPQDETVALDGADLTEADGMLGWESDPGEDDAALAAYREEASALDRSLQTQSPERHTGTAEKRKVRTAKEVRISKRGLEYSSFPSASVKKLALSFMKSQGSKARLSKDTLAVLSDTTDDFFEQISIDLAAYAQHAGRKIIEESDVIALMKRYVTFHLLYTSVRMRESGLLTAFRTRKTTSTSTPFSLAQKMLPRELLQQLRMEPPVKLKGQKRKRMNPIQEEED